MFFTLLRKNFQISFASGNCLSSKTGRINLSTSSAYRSVRVRFAPSPTGFLHIGGLRTALLNYLFAESKGGKFIIRIEDTDQTRIVPGAVDNLLKQLKWIGITPHEGPVVGGACGPYVQSQRLKTYQEYADELLRNGSAYRCFCSQRRLDIMRRDQLRRKEQSRYDNRCRNLSEQEIKTKLERGEPYAVRLKLSDGIRSFVDELYGNISHDLATIEGDPVIFKSDGFPTYHLANVIDDHLMKITHVLRGREWINSTVKHVMLYEALGWTPPRFAHLPLFLNEDGKKLSKRQGDVFVEQYREKGYHPTALLNFMIHHGAGFHDDIGTIYGNAMATPKSALEKIVPHFSLEKVGNTDSLIRFWKLEEFNSSILRHLLKTKQGKHYLVEKLTNLIMEKYGADCLLSKMDSDAEKIEYVLRVLTIRQTHIKTIKCLTADEYSYVWTRPNVAVENCDRRLMELTRSVYKVLEEITDEDMTSEALNSKIRITVKESDLKMAQAMEWLRYLLIGRKEGPGVAEILCIIGRYEAIARLNVNMGHSVETARNISER